jgi:hypothetical protein
MNVLLMLTMALLWSGAPIQAQAEQRPILVERMCGKLIRYRQVPIKGTTNTFDVKTKALPRVDLNLYRGNGNAKCCESLSVVAKTKTGRRGSFEFKNVVDDIYWLVASVDGRDYKMLIRYQPKKNSDEKCSENWFQIEDSGSFGFGKTITVD